MRTQTEREQLAESIRKAILAKLTAIDNYDDKQLASVSSRMINQVGHDFEAIVRGCDLEMTFRVIG